MAKEITLACDLNYAPVGPVRAYAVEGGCLEGAEVPDGSVVLVDMGITRPMRGDITVCTTLTGATALKRLEFYYGLAYVRTVYADKSKNRSFAVKSVTGAAFACLDANGELITELRVYTPPADPFEAVCQSPRGDINTAEGWNSYGQWQRERAAWLEANATRPDVIAYNEAAAGYRSAVKALD